MQKVALPKPPVVLYHYDASPFATKVKNMLALKGIPHNRVTVSLVAPRPELSGLLGLTYRRIPVLTIGNDVYCDTSLIASVLERRFPASDGYGTLFPPRKGGGRTDTGMIKAFVMSYADRTLFTLAAECLPYHKFEPQFVKDRSAWLGMPIDGQAILARQPEVKSTLASHLTLLEEQLADGREWLSDTDSPSLADISVHFIYNWIRTGPFKVDLFDGQKFPNSISWLSRMSAYLDYQQKTRAAFETLTGGEAAEMIISSPYEDSGVVGFDNLEAGRLGVKMGDVVSVVPRDTGKVATVGRLVGLDREEVIIQTKGSANAVVHCHFPRLNFSIRTIQDSSKENSESAKL
ncbi:hypothetical protein B0H21DRAFT_805801 [Amylocystis lapponica]|nr:hypothetical protein B0H21DRAFT_805801 [Amylocystis lapponica]